MIKELDFSVQKTEEAFRRNYSLHDIAEHYGKKLLRSRGFTTKDFGIDMREKDVWEAGENTPDVKVYKGETFLTYLDWKGKTSEEYLGVMNERSYKSYLHYSPCWVLWFLINKKKEKIEEIRCAHIGKAEVEEKWREWNGNTVVKISGNDLLSFSGFLDCLQ